MGGLRRTAVALVGVVLLAACGADDPPSSAPGTDDASRPLDDGRQRPETFIEPTPQSGGLFDEPPSSVDAGAPTSEAPTGTDDVETDSTTANSPTTGPDGSSPAASGPASNEPFAATSTAFARFADESAVSLTIISDGEIIVQEASGLTQDDEDLETDSPMVVAGVSKLLTTLAVARLEQQDLVDTAAPIPFDAMGLSAHEKWAPITVRDLIDQTSGMPAKNNLWKTSTDDCETNVATLVSSKPVAKRLGQRTDANGNACLLGLLIESVTGEPLVDVVQRLVFDPLDLDGLHSTTDGLLAGDGGVLADQEATSTGGAGSYVVSTDDLAAVFAELSAADLAAFDGTATMKDQYGWGHTGITKGLSSCLWVLDEGSTVVAATAVGTGVKGGVACDRFVPAIAGDLELGLGTSKPDRNK